MPLAGFGPALSRSERPQSYALDRTATDKCDYCVQFKEQNTINSARTGVDIKTRS